MLSPLKSPVPSGRWFKPVDLPPAQPHGYQSLADHSEVLYLVTEFYTPNAERGLRWNDPAFGIDWPLPDPILSPKDAVHPDYAA